jgi:hypothetical protein
MQIIEGLYNLLEKSSTYGFLDHSVGTLSLYILVNTYATDIIGYDTYLLCRFNEVVHFDNIGMVDLSESYDLPLHGLSLHAIIELYLVIYLNGVFLLGLFVMANPYNSICSLSDDFSNLVVFELG